MNTSESLGFLSDALLEDERIVTSDEREFLADLLRRSENNPKEFNPEITRAIARIAGEIVVERASALMGDGILRRLSSNHLTAYDQRLTREHGTRSLGPRPPVPTPPNPGPTPGGVTQYGKSRMTTLGPRPPVPTPPNPGPTPGGVTQYGKSRMTLGPRPPVPTPPNPGPTPGGVTAHGPKGILDPDMPCGELLPPKCIVLEEFLAPAELNDLMNYTLAHQEHFIVSEVIAPGVKTSSDFDYRRSHVLMDLGPHQQIILNRLCLTLPRVLPRLGIELFPISRMEAQITSSKDGDFFHWHSDNGTDEVAARQITFVYFFHREPKAFEGGELRIQSGPWNGNVDDRNYYTIIPRQNQVVLFDSSLTHEIAFVKCPSGKFADSRFTVNGWFSR